MEYENKYFKIFEKEYESKFNNYRDENVEEKNIYHWKIKQFQIT